MSSLYIEHFGMREEPFSLAPDPRYLYASEQHREALAHLIYGVQGEGGFVLLTGEVGTGKTTMFRCLLERLPEKTKVAFVLHPKLSATELLATVCDEFGIDYPEGSGSTKAFVDLLNRYLLEISSEGYHVVLIIDEAQNLSLDVLEQLRLLTNLETSRRKLLQIILLGQPELREMLARPEMKQLAQRVTARFHLGALHRRDVGPYVEHRLSVAGGPPRLFPPRSIPFIHRFSGGVPRVINLLCDRALLGTFTEGKRTVTADILKKAAGEIDGAPATLPSLSWKAILGLLSLAAAALFLALGSPGIPGGGSPSGEEKGETPGGPAPALPEGARISAATEESPEAAVEEKSLEWLFGRAGGNSRIPAEKTLLSLWGILPPEYGGGDSLCEAARAGGLLCLRSSGGMGDLARHRLPAVIRLAAMDGGELFACLTSLSGDRATLSFADGSGEVQLRWFGEYTLLWRPPRGYSRPLLPGERSPLVPWVRERMALTAGGGKGGGVDDLFDATLAGAVRSFQSARGLEPDGIVGPLTVIHLNRLGVNGDPSLVSRGEEG